MSLVAHTDTFLEIGSTHRMCQDYVLSATGQQSELVIVCDGCSSSRDVDVGARVLAHSARVVTEQMGLSGAGCLGTAIIEQAARTAWALGLRYTSLDATLLLACYFRHLGRVVIYAWGDGVIHYDMGGIRRTVHISYPSNAPYYLSYQLNPVRDAGYARDYGQAKEITSEMTVEGKSSKITALEPWRSPFVLDLPAAPGYVLLGSDGINSFQKGDPVPYDTIMNELTAFKSLAGEFVTRRMNFFKRRAQAEGITHYDDFGVAAMCLEPAPVPVLGSTGTIHSWPPQPWET